jgi:hypothetical protein
MAQRPRMRPTFTLDLPGDGQPVLERLNSLLERDGDRITGQVVKGHACLRVARDQRSMLSPFLNLELDAPEDANGDGVVLKGRFSPHPNVWTGFMAIYIILILIAIGGAMFGWAQMTVDEYPWGFWFIPAAAALYAFVYGAAVIGQGLTADEMYELRAMVDEACEDCRRKRAAE